MSNSTNGVNTKRLLLFINIIITCIASSMLATALTTALPSMIKDFNVSVSTGQWLTSGYSLAMGITMPLTAFLINRFPTRKLYLTAIVVFIAGLVLCVLAPNFVVLMCGRVLQACGNGILTSMSQVIILSIFPPDKRGTAMGWYGLSVGAAPVIAPTLAGLVVDSYGWQMIFYFAIGIMLISLIFALFVFADILETSNRRFDISSFLLSVFAFGGITLGVGNISSYPFVSVQVLLLLVVGVISGIIFAYRQLHLEEPLLELRILKNKEYTLSVVGSMILYLVMMGSSIILPLYVQTIMGRSATISGIVALPGSLIMALVSPFAGKMYDKLGMKMLFIIGSSFMLISNIGMIFINMSSPLIVAAILNVIRCAAIGCLMMPFVTWGTSKIDKSSTAHATALLTSLRTISGAIGSAVFVGIMTAVGNSSKAAYGSNAQIHGLNVTFAFMSLATTALLLIAIFCVKNKKKTLK